MDSVSLAEGSEAVSILGGSRLDEELFIKLKAAGIRYVSTRTVGFNHIDVPAAHRYGIMACNAGYPPYGVAEWHRHAHVDGAAGIQAGIIPSRRE